MSAGRAPDLKSRSAPFLDWLERWCEELRPISLRGEIIAETGNPASVAVMVVDLLVGFCNEGPLASPRVGALGPPSARFLQDAWDAGIRRFILNADSHSTDAPEFQAFPRHCVTGTAEAEPITEISRLPFFNRFSIITKNSINVGHEPELARWQRTRKGANTWILVGDCTDFCVYQAAMHLRTQANARGENLRVIVPANLVETYDLPVESAARIGALPHDADLIHRLFLYHMAVNGITVVREITP